MQVSIDADDIHKTTTDDRGRLTLGSQFARKTVEVAVLAVDGEPATDE